MADVDDMEMVECPVCKKRCPKDFYPLCTCKCDDYAGKSRPKGLPGKKKQKSLRRN